MRPAPKSTTIDVPPLSVRADVTSVDEATRTVELTFSSGAAVQRYDWRTGTRYLEKLSIKPEHIRLGRLNANAPLLDAHSAWSISDQIGVVQPGSARVAGKNDARAIVRFSKRDAVEPIWGDVRDGIIRNVSVGYLVHTFEEVAGKDNALPVRTAVDWEPYEISMVPMPADTGAHVRSGDQTLTNPCVLVTRSEVTAMNEDTQSETLLERNPLDPGAPIVAAERLTLARTTDEPNQRDLGATQERERVQGILLACRAARMPQAFADAQIKSGTTLVQAQSAIFAELQARDQHDRGPSENAVRVEVTGDDPFVHVRGGITNAILHRCAPERFKLEDVGRQYRGLTLLDTARLFLQARNTRVTGMSKMDIAGAALGLTHRAGMHTTSDFALLLADVTAKTLRREYEEAPQTYVPLGRRVTLPDFKMAKRLQIGDAPQLLAISENGEYTRGTMAEAREQFQLLTYGRVFAITRTALVNDDTDAFARVPMAFGRAARNLESNLVWAQITSNPVMGDGIALFHASHSNLDATGDAIAITPVAQGRAAMRNQKGIDTVTFLNISPKYLVVPPAIETVADQFVSTNLMASQTSAVNPFAGRLQVISEPRLEVADANAWFLAADPGQIDMLEFGYLEGEEGPAVESRIGFDVDGLEVKARLDFGAKVIDYRGFYRNDGA